MLLRAPRQRPRICATYLVGGWPVWWSPGRRTGLDSLLCLESFATGETQKTQSSYARDHSEQDDPECRDHGGSSRQSRWSPDYGIVWLVWCTCADGTCVIACPVLLIFVSPRYPHCDNLVLGQTWISPSYCLFGLRIWPDRATSQTWFQGKWMIPTPRIE